MARTKKTKLTGAAKPPAGKRAEVKTDEPAKRGPGRPKKTRVDEAPPREFGNALPQVAAVLKSHEARLEGQLAKVKAARAALGEE